MTRKTPEEIEAMAKEMFPESPYVHPFWIQGYASNQELADFKKELVEKVKLMERHCIEDDIERGKQLAYEKILDLITQEDKPEVKKEEVIRCKTCHTPMNSNIEKKEGLCNRCYPF
jgi:protein-arginine kinase activator protein McsA